MIMASRLSRASLLFNKCMRSRFWFNGGNAYIVKRTGKKTIDILLNYSATLSVRHVMSADYQIATKRDQRVLIQVIILAYILHYLSVELA